MIKFAQNIFHSFISTFRCEDILTSRNDARKGLETSLLAMEGGTQ